MFDLPSLQCPGSCGLHNIRGGRSSACAVNMEPAWADWEDVAVKAGGDDSIVWVLLCREGLRLPGSSCVGSWNV